MIFKNKNIFLGITGIIISIIGIVFLIYALIFILKNPILRIIAGLAAIIYVLWWNRKFWKGELPLNFYLNQNYEGDKK